MSRSALRDALRQAPARKYAKNTLLWRDGDRRSGLWLIKSGAVKTFRITPGGEEQVTGFYLPGEYLGIDELPGESHRGYAQVTDDCAVHQLSPSQLEAFMDTRDARRYVYRLMSDCLRGNKARLRQLSRLSAGERLAHLIYDIASRYGAEGRVMCEFRLPMLRYDIADYTGMAPETVTREMLKLVAAGAFRFRGRQVSGLRADMMAKLAGNALSYRPDGHGVKKMRRAGKSR